MTDERMDLIIGNLLRTGVALSAVVVAIGGAWYLAGGGQPSEKLILAGLLILIATPIARVVFSLVAFAIQHDRVYVAVTAIVLAVLLYSIGTAWL